jgi:hypothetical protein
VATTFPTTLDDFPNPTSEDQLNNASTALKHSVQHSNVNDALEALEAKVGIDTSAVTGSLDYKIKNGSFIRKDVTATTGSLAPAATDSTQTIIAGKACTAIRIKTSRIAWVRIYASAADQTADSGRAITTDPTPGTGVLLEVLTTAADAYIDLAPAAMLYSLEDSPGTTLHITVTNKDTTTGTIVVTVTVVPLEG